LYKEGGVLDEAVPFLSKGRAQGEEGQKAR